MIERSKDLRGQIQMMCIDELVPGDHLLRKIDKAVNFERVYGMTKHLYDEHNGRPAVDPVVLVKAVFVQHLFGIRSLRQTVKEIDMNIAYRRFLPPVPRLRNRHAASAFCDDKLRVRDEISERNVRRDFRLDTRRSDETGFRESEDDIRRRNALQSEREQRKEYNGTVKQDTQLKNEFPSDKLKQQTDGGKENGTKRTNSRTKSESGDRTAIGGA